MIFRRGKYYHYRFWFGGRLVQKSTKQQNKDAAKNMESAERTRLSLVAAGLESPLRATDGASRTTVKELLDALEVHYQQNGKLTLQNLSLLNRARKDFGRSVAADLTRDHGKDYISKRQKAGAANATINRITGLVNRAFTLAGKTPQLPRLSEKGNTRTGFFVLQEFETVCSKLPADLQDFARFGYLVGWRKGEIASLRWADVQDGVVRLRGEDSKNESPRCVSITGELANIIERRRGARAIHNGSSVRLAEWIFHRDGRQVREFRGSWQTVCIAAGLGNMACPKCEAQGPEKKCPKCKTARKYHGRIFHDLRRSSVRNMIRAGVPEKIAMGVSGHKTRSLFDRYNVINEADLQNAMEKVDQFHKAEQAKIAAIS